jgi:hypothetical protein
VRRASTGWRQSAAAVLAALVVVALAPACGAPHLGLSTSSANTCYRAIPPAKAAVHDGSAHLVGVHLVPVDKARAEIYGAALAGKDDDASVCVVVLHGTFSAGQVTLAPPLAEGHYAVLLISISHLGVVGAVVLDDVPRGFGRRLT